MQIIQANLVKMGLVTMLYITTHLNCRTRFQRKSENLLFYQQSKRKQKYANWPCRLCKTFIANVGFAILPPLDFTHQNKKATLSGDRKYSLYQKCLKLNYYFSSPKKFTSLKKLFHHLMKYLKNNFTLSTITWLKFIHLTKSFCSLEKICLS